MHRIGPGQGVGRPGLRIVDYYGLGDSLDHDANMPKTRGTGRQSGAEQHLGFDSRDGPGDHAGHVDGGRVEHPGLDERRERRDLGAQERSRRHHPGTPVPSSRSLSALTSSGGTCQLKTPCGLPPTTGVPAPAIPRTKRYAVPPKCLAGS